MLRPKNLLQEFHVLRGFTDSAPRKDNRKWNANPALKYPLKLRGNTLKMIRINLKLKTPINKEQYVLISKVEIKEEHGRKYTLKFEKY